MTAVISLLSLQIKPECLEEAKSVLGGALDQTRAFAGSGGVQLVVDVKDPCHWVAVESWESIEADDAYRLYRRGEGALTELGPLLAASPELTRAELV